MKARSKMPVVSSMDGVRATGVRPAGGDGGSRATVGGLGALAVVLCLAVIAAVARIGRLEEELRRITSHKDHHQLAVDGCLKALESHVSLSQLSALKPAAGDDALVVDGGAAVLADAATPEAPAAAAAAAASERPRQPDIPAAPTSVWEPIFRRSFPAVDSSIASCVPRPELECTSSMCIAITLKASTWGATTTAQCAGMCAAMPDCAYFWLTDVGGCCLKSSYDAAKALGANGMRLKMAGDYYQLTARGPGADLNYGSTVFRPFSD